MYRQSENKIVKQYLLYMSPQYGELQPTSGWDRFFSFGAPQVISAGFVRVLAALLHGTLVVGVSQTAALNRGRHLYSAGRPSSWALAHISSCKLFSDVQVTASPGKVTAWIAKVSFFKGDQNLILRLVLV